MSNFSYNLDTLSLAEELISAGFSEKQAKAQAQIFRRIIESQKLEREQELEAKELATKADIYKLELKIKASENKLIYWVVGSSITTILTLAGVLVAIVQFGKQ